MKYKKNFKDYSLALKILIYILETAKVGFNIYSMFSYQSISYKYNTDKWPWDVNKYYFKRTLGRMESSGLIKTKKVGPAIEIQITRKGWDLWRKTRVGDLKIEKPKKWDGIWRLVIFDIPEKQRDTRDLFRAKLKELGFVQVQQSTWAIPYDCQELMLALAKIYKIEKYAALFEGQYVGNDKQLRRKFKL